MAQLGELERAVMEFIWRAEAPVSVRRVLDGVERTPSPAYTTVMTRVRSTCSPPSSSTRCSRTSAHICVLDTTSW